MNYRAFPGTDITTSVLGMGCMRLPTINNEGKEIDRPAAIDMIRTLIDNGVTYVDTAYMYHDGDSERLVGEALRDGYREKVTLTTKLPVWEVKQYSDMERLLDEQLGKLQTDHVDFYLAHALDEKRYDDMVKLGLFKFMDEMVEKGKIRYPGFSFHDGAEAFRKIVDGYDWKLAQVQMNVLDEFNQATMDGVRYAVSKGIGIVVMEPVRGGALTKSVPSEISALYAKVDPDRSAAEWAFRWLIDKPEFVTILSGMSSMEQAMDNLRIFSEADVGCLSGEEKSILEQVRLAYEKRVRVGCTGCEYCMPCPQGINIPQILKGFDTAAMFDDYTEFKGNYERAKANATDCVNCESCVDACPQHFATPIPEMLKRIHEEITAK